MNVLVAAVEAELKITRRGIVEDANPAGRRRGAELGIAETILHCSARFTTV